MLLYATRGRNRSAQAPPAANGRQAPRYRVGGRRARRLVGKWAQTLRALRALTACRRGGAGRAGEGRCRRWNRRYPRWGAEAGAPPRPAGVLDAPLPKLTQSHAEPRGLPFSLSVAGRLGSPQGCKADAYTWPNYLHESPAPFEIPAPGLPSWGWGQPVGREVVLVQVARGPNRSARRPTLTALPALSTGANSLATARVQLGPSLVPACRPLTLPALCMQTRALPAGAGSTGSAGCHRDLASPPPRPFCPSAGHIEATASDPIPSRLGHADARERWQTGSGSSVPPELVGPGWFVPVRSRAGREIQTMRFTNPSLDSGRRIPPPPAAAKLCGPSGGQQCRQ